TRRLIAGMRTYGYPAAVMPEVNVATFFCRNAPADWQVSRTRKGHLRIVCMPHVHRGIIEAFLSDVGTLPSPQRDV
ncbi:MAG: tyrosine decarboxylase MfnA, partial [Methanomicrobiales archaeon]|nr:tyrosine decarboxylase MfnA [Methanomicrobiales archaeon]